MAHVDADRNLLFGLVALQNNFIDRDALLDAFTRWMHDRAIPLGRVLRDREALKADEYDLLQALVAKHLEKFGGDAQKSLQHLSSIGSAREDLSRVADSDLQASLANVSVARPDDDPHRTASHATFGEPTSIGSRFRILRPHAKGGLGQVSVALDHELDRPVALKEIQEHHADEPHSRARFVQEAEITGKLEHPGIIPVYGLGRDASGRPFYAMRFIQGDSLKEAIASFHGEPGRVSAGSQFRTDTARTRGAHGSPLAFRELLRRFTDVCNAVAYAHSRGVLHRDLKPGNIMLGPYGETLVVDWGLAKPIGEVSSSEATPGDVALLREGPIRLSGQSSSRVDTVAGSPMGTPAYASPEQMTGALDRLGPATDIYGLGATLYALLTGHAPVEADDRGEVIRRVQRGEILPPRSIDPKIPKPLEAICRKAMATNPDDRYGSARELANDVTKWLDDEPVSAYREPVSVRAWRWMRRHRTAMIGTAAAGLVGLIGLAAVAAVQAQYNRELKLANEKTSRALNAETKAKKDAQDALTRSEEARRRAEAVLGFLKDDVLAAARPEGQEGGLGVEVTVRKAVEAAEPKIAERFKDEPIVEADIRDTLGQTYLYLREGPLAIQQLERAVELLQTRLNTDHRDMCASRNNLATAYLFAGRTDDAIKMYEATLKLFESKLGPDHPDTLTCHNNLASAYEAAGRTDEAIKINEATLEQRESKLGPDHHDTHQSRNNLALNYRDAGRIAEAITMLEANLKNEESKLGPDHPDTLASRSNLANVFLDAGRTDDAIRMLEATLKLYESKLGPDHPDTLTCRANLANAYQAVGRTDDAIRMHSTTLKQRESKLGSDHPNTLISRMSLAVSYRAAGQLDRAVSLLQQAFQGFAATVGPNHPYTVRSQDLLADAYAAAGRHSAAETLLRNNLERARKRFGPSDPRTSVPMAQLGSNLIQQRKWADAEPILRNCLVIREKAQPDNWSTFNSRSMLGGSLLGQKKFADAEPLIVTGYEGLKAREAKIPADRKARLTEAAERVVELFEAWGKQDKAAEWRAKLAKVPAEAKAKP